ncbi:MAG TPA: lactate utilization protein [Pyrinomonadaceae bacterium]|nr:lactate utilization protein [Pyrinomonadaceae bacterium]
MEGLPGGREQMLAQIRDALGRRAVPAVAPAPLPPFHSNPDGLDAGERVARFIFELKRVGAGVEQLSTEAEVKEHLAGLLPAGTDVPVALSDGAALRRLGLREWLEGAGRRVLPSLREFVAEGLEAGGARREPDARGEEVAALVEQYRGLLLEAAVGVTAADLALADTGTLVIVSGEEQHRLISLLPPTHVCLLDPARVLPSLTQLLAHVRRRFNPPRAAPKNMTCITGPSRTADIEQAITTGVHGPKTLHVILYSPGS